MMRLVWTRNKSPLSRLIRFSTGEPVSHFAIIFDEWLVFQSNLYGVNLSTLKRFSAHNEIVHSITYNQPLNDEESVYRGIIEKFDGKSYDVLALLYFGWRVLLLKLFDIAMPSRNAWGSKNAFMCTELAIALPSWMVPFRRDCELGMITPYRVYQIVAIYRGLTGEAEKD